jgi:hypothetical protein
MGTYEMMVVQSTSLTNHCENQYSDGDRARQRAETFIKGAIEESTSHTVNFLTPSGDMYAPQQEIQGSFDAKYPCDRTFTINYDNLLQYFDDGLDCVEEKRAADANIIIPDTNDSDGGLAYGCGDYSGLGGARTGQGIAQASWSYETHGYDFEHTAVHTLLEELGHILLNCNTTDGDGDGIYDHDSGKIDFRDSGNTISPMSIDDIEGDNACEKYNNCNRSWWCDTVDGWSLYFADCATDEFKSP